MNIWKDNSMKSMYNSPKNGGRYVLVSFVTCVVICFFSCQSPAQQKRNATSAGQKQSTGVPRSFTSISSIRDFNTTSDYVDLIAPGRNGSFRYAPEDKLTTDNGGTVIVTKAGRRYKRILEGPINAQLHFAAKGDGVADDTQALQSAINAACRANNPAKNGANSPANGSNTVYIPHGSYKVTGEILIQGSCSIIMEQANSYGGTRIRQVTPGKNLFHIIKDNDGQSSGVHIIGGILQGGVSRATPNTALVYGGEGKEDANNNSTYIDNVWFQTPEQYAVHFLRGDDIQIRNCTFDVSAYHSIRFGSTANPVTNSIITGCTFYDIRAGIVDLINVDGLIVSNNRAYTDDKNRVPYFINANGSSIKGLQIILNQLSHIDRLAFINHNSEDVQISNNMHRYGSGRCIELGGGQTISTIHITNNMIAGNFSGTVKVGNVVPDAAIFGHSTGLTNSRITGNTIRHTGKKNAPTPILLTDKRVLRNVITDNTLIGFDDSGRFSNN